MRVFVTGATGFIGSALTKELIAAGHQVLGLCRSEDKAAALAATGAEIHRGSLEDPDSLAAGARQADGVVHLAFNHDFSRYAANCEDDRRVIAALAGALTGSGRPLIVTSGTGMARATPGEPAREDSPPISSDVIPRGFGRGGGGRRRGGGQGCDRAPAAGARYAKAGPDQPGDPDVS